VIVVSDKFKLRRRQHKNQKKNQTDEVEVDDKMVFAKEDVEAIAQVMELAPGNI
jgi:hypothetical protein